MMTSEINAYLKIARFDNWTKNFVVFFGVLLAGVLIPPPEGIKPIQVFLAFMSMCLASSANYVINEFLDSRFDSLHPTKKYRSAVKNQLKPLFVYMLYALFFSGAVFTARLVNANAFYIILLYLVCGWLYNIRPVRIKDIAYLDVILESFNYPLRILIGWACVVPGSLPPSSIILGSWAVGAFAMTAKRLAEYRLFGSHEQAGAYRKAYKNYTANSLIAASMNYAMLSAFAMAVFLIKYRVEFIFAFPFICVWFSMYMMMALRGGTEAVHPEKLFKRHGLMALSTFILILFYVLLKVDIPLVHTLNEPLDFIKDQKI